MRHLSQKLLCMVAAAATAGSCSAGELLVDPTRHPAQPTAADASPQSAGVQVQAVFSRPEGLIAIVNGKVVRAGDRLGSISIAEVTTEGVRYVQDNHIRVARMPTVTLEVRHGSNPKKKDP